MKGTEMGLDEIEEKELREIEATGSVIEKLLSKSQKGYITIGEIRQELKKKK